MSMRTVANDNKLLVTSRLGQHAYHMWGWGVGEKGRLLQVRGTNSGVSEAPGEGDASGVGDASEEGDA